MWCLRQHPGIQKGHQVKTKEIQIKYGFSSLKKKERSYGINHPGNANQNHNEISPHINENDHQKKKKKEEDISVDERVDKKGNPREPLMRMQIGTTTLKISVELL